MLSTGRATLAKNQSVFEFLVGCDFMISITSTSIFWGILLEDRPFAWVLPGHEGLVGNISLMAQVVNNSSETVDSLVHKLKYAMSDYQAKYKWNHAREQYICEHSTGFDGNLNSRIPK